MSFEWSHYLDVAQSLAEQAREAAPAQQEAMCRASISRAYYAAFGTARYYLLCVDKIAEPGPPLINARGEPISIHRYVRDAFRNSPDQRRIDIGKALDSLFFKRNVADYDGYGVIPKNLLRGAYESLAWARATLACLERLQNGGE